MRLIDGAKHLPQTFIAFVPENCCATAVNLVDDRLSRCTILNENLGKMLLAWWQAAGTRHRFLALRWSISGGSWGTM